MKNAEAAISCWSGGSKKFEDWGGGGLKNVDEDISVEIGTGSQILISIIFWPAPEDEILTAQCRET